MFILTMIGMLKMLSVTLMTSHSVMTNADYLWNGLGYNVFTFSVFLRSFSCCLCVLFLSLLSFSLHHPKQLNLIRVNVVVNVVIILMGLNLWQTRGPQKPCFASTLIPSAPGFRILKDTLNPMGSFLMSEFGGTLHLCSLRLRKKLLKPFRQHT